MIFILGLLLFYFFWLSSYSVHMNFVLSIALAINMLFICRLVFNGNGLDVDEYVQRAFKFAYSDCIEVGPVACLPEPPNPSELYPRQSCRASHLGLLYLGSLMVLLVYSILYGVTAKEAHWLGAITSAAVIILDWYMGACLYGFKLLNSRVAALFVAGTSWVFLICFGVHYWYLGHCVSYAVVASFLLGAAVSRHLSATNPLAARRDALQSAVIRLREGFRKKEQNSSSSSSEGCGSSMKCSSSVEVGNLGNVIEASGRSMAQCTVDGGSWNNAVLCRTASSQEGINSDNSIDSGRPSLALRSSSCCSVIQEAEIGMSCADKNVDHTSSLMVCSSSGLESQGCESSASTSANQQALDYLALAFQERLNDPRITSMLKRRARQDRDHRDNTDITAIDSNSVDNAMPHQISLSEELRLRGLEKWLQLSRLVLHHVAGTPERAWVLFSFVFILETIIVTIFRPKTIKIINATHQQFEFGFAVLLLSPVVCSIMAFLRSLQVEDVGMTLKPRKYGFIAWLLSTCVGLLLSFLSKSSVLLGLSLTVPLMVACLSVAIPIWIRNNYQFLVPRVQCAGNAGNHRTPGTKEADE
nr:calpain-type cysteine protease dek1 [Quercus suber]